MAVHEAAEVEIAGRAQRGEIGRHVAAVGLCLLYTSDAADERSSVDLGGRRIIKKKKHSNPARQQMHNND